MGQNYKTCLVSQSSGANDYYGKPVGNHKQTSDDTIGYMCTNGQRVFCVASVRIGDEPIDIFITDPYDALIMAGLDKENPTDLFIYGKIILKYDKIGAYIIEEAAEAGSTEACLMIGQSLYDCSNERMMEEGKDYTKKAAEAGDVCGKCLLGRYYAEGKGCKKDRLLAKKYFSEAAVECEDAEGYLDKYGLR